MPISHEVTKTWTETRYKIDELDSELFESCDEAVFEKRSIVIDEMAWVEDGKVELSSYQKGLVSWSDKKKQYVHHYHFAEYNLGKFLFAIKVS